MAKTPLYTKKAIDNYRAKRDLVQLFLPKGSKMRMEEITGESITAHLRAYVQRVIDDHGGLDAAIDLSYAHTTDTPPVAVSASSGAIDLAAAGAVSAAPSVSPASSDAAQDNSIRIAAMQAMVDARSAEIAAQRRQETEGRLLTDAKEDGGPEPEYMRDWERMMDREETKDTVKDLLSAHLDSLRRDHADLVRVRTDDDTPKESYDRASDEGASGAAPDAPEWLFS